MTSAWKGCVKYADFDKLHLYAIHRANRAVKGGASSSQPRARVYTHPDPPRPIFREAKNFYKDVDSPKKLYKQSTPPVIYFKACYDIIQLWNLNIIILQEFIQTAMK